ncbi:anthranilate synthase component I family protein [Prochlorococcus sp. MIT 1223]|uniref:anthranilate synthase component I family protein n=1 Tax=Prochlorococcus sp. MIT 1223 TaxID=3096217 RepID=UPI002A74DCCA|nr:anthranilate synthase component I family protein [Prochlorococcus sp. MIT 1223]
MTALYRELCSWKEPEFIAQKLIEKWGEHGLIWLDGDGSKLGRWVTLATDPIESICCRGLPTEKGSVNPFEILRTLEPGHWTGWLSYEAGAWIEPNNPWKSDSMATLWIASHDPILKFDLMKKELWIEGKNKRRLERMSSWIRKLQLRDISKDAIPRIAEIPLNSWQWYTSKHDFSHNVAHIKELIEQGDIFQANLTTGCTTELSNELSAMTIFEQLRKKCPAPFSGVMIGSDNALGEAVISTSPERFLQVDPKGEIETRPIKGTRPRNKNLETDADMAIDLVSSIKDRAENIMIVDLLRNDLGRVCKPGSIHIPYLLNLESYAQVHHLTSVIRGSIQANKSWVDVLEACWPGGSISGAPKLRACQRINEIEKIARGPYCGSFITIGWDGTFDSNILIRSLIMKNSTLRANAGCGIVADSDPLNETEEMTWKLMPILKALEK